MKLIEKGPPSFPCSSSVPNIHFSSSGKKKGYWTSFEGRYITLTRPPFFPLKFFMCTVCSPRPSLIFILRVLDVSTVTLSKCQFHCRCAWKWILSGAKWALLDAFSIS